jgi:pimeloyl-ACP methyl ester carboxylesterase
VRLESRHAALRRSLVAVITVAGILCVAPMTAAAPQSNATRTRVTCPFDERKALLPVECGRLKVPENYDNSGREIAIAYMIVHPKKNRDPDAPALFLSGGPGSPSLFYAELLTATPEILEVVVDRDWIFYDQRGTGRSIPALRCPQEANYLKRVRLCRDQLMAEGIDLSQYNSKRSGQDIEALRKALGVKQWNLWGISYGSRLAFSVARDFPTTVRSMVHDGPSDPESPEIVEDFRGTEAAINKLLLKCAADSACRSTYPDLRVRFLAAVPRLRQQSLKVGDEQINDQQLIQYIRGYLFTGDPAILERRVQLLLAYMDAAARGDSQLMHQIMQDMPEEKEDNAAIPVEGWYSMGQNLSVECNEERAFESPEKYQQAAARSDIVRGLFGGDGGMGMFQDCAIWPSGQADATRKSRVNFNGPQLVFTGELDASLSGLSGYKIKALYPNARNIVFKNATHGQADLADLPRPTVNDYTRCALLLARQFFANPRVPLNTSCAESRKMRLTQ